MILHSFENANKSSIVSFSQGEYIVMKYVNNEYIDEEVASDEYMAIIKADDWIKDATTS